MQMQVDGEDNGRYGDGELEGDGDGIDGDMIDDIEDDEDPLQGRQADVKAIAKLMSSKQVQDLLQKVATFQSTPRTAADNMGPVEEDPEYKVLVGANNMMFDIDTEILLVHKFIRDHYSKRFPELESLVPNALDFARTVKAIGNEMDLMNVVDLKPLLPSATVMIVTVTATTTSGQALSETELASVLEACDLALLLESTKRELLEYVESRMSFIAPNISAIIGPTTAAKIMGIAGGLSALSKIPACNLLVLGKVGKGGDTGGLFAKGQLKHAGFIYYSDIVQSVPKEYRVKASRMVAAKCTLAARIDRAREHSDGYLGKQFRDEIVRKLEKSLEPPPTKSIKALAVPTEGRKSRRAGRRIRKLKEKFAVTDAQKMQNRLKFGEAEEEVLVGDTVKGLGLIGGQTGRVRALQADQNKKIGVARKHRVITGGGSGATSGLSSSLAFTPVQGIELENPEAVAARKRAAVQEANDKYFGTGKKRA